MPAVITALKEKEKQKNKNKKGKTIMFYGGGIRNELILCSKSSLNIVIISKPDVQKA